MRSIVIGLGETGLPLYQVLREAYGEDVAGYDINHERLAFADIRAVKGSYDVLHICIGWSDRFCEIVKEHQCLWSPTITIIHSTVPVGTTRKIGNAVHSPILGKHGRMLEDMRTYPKWIGGERAEEVAPYFEGAKMRTETVKTPEETEALKLMCLAKYGMSIAFSIYKKQICDKLGIPYEDVHLWDTFYNENVMPSLKRPLIEPPHDGMIGGHCVVPGSRILNEQFPNVMLFEVLRHNKNNTTETTSSSVKMEVVHVQ